MADFFCSAHADLIARLAEHVADLRVVDAMRAVPRALFVPDEQRSAAYEDRALPIDADDAVPPPSLVARICEVLDLRGDEHIMDVGVGLGYRSAVLAGLCREVLSVSASPVLAEAATVRLRRAGIRNARVVVGDPAAIAVQHGPWHVIVLADRADRVVQRMLEDQLLEGGRLLVSPIPGRRLRLSCRRDGQRPVRLVPLRRGLHLG